MWEGSHQCDFLALARLHQERGAAEPSPASLGLGPSTLLPPDAPPAVQAEYRQDPTRVGSWPDPGIT